MFLTSVVLALDTLKARLPTPVELELLCAQMWLQSRHRVVTKKTAKRVVVRSGTAPWTYRGRLLVVQNILLLAVQNLIILTVRRLLHRAVQELLILSARDLLLLKEVKDLLLLTAQGKDLLPKVFMVRFCFRFNYNYRTTL